MQLFDIILLSLLRTSCNTYYNQLFCRSAFESTANLCTQTL